MKFAFYISGRSERLLKFLECASVDHLACISIVISEYKIQSELAQKLASVGIEQVVIEYDLLKGKSNQEKNIELSDAMLVALKARGVDYCFSFGRHLLAGRLLEEYKNRIINFHPALLPLFPGNNAIDQAVECGNVFLVGNTAHFIDEGMDTGMVIMQSVIPLQPFLEERDYNRILDLQVIMLEQLMGVLLDGRLNIEADRVVIANADYSSSCVFPRV